MKNQTKHGSFDKSRRNALVSGAARIAALGLPKTPLAAQSSPAGALVPHGSNQGETHMNMITIETTTG